MASRQSYLYWSVGSARGLPGVLPVSPRLRVPATAVPYLITLHCLYFLSRCLTTCCNSCVVAKNVTSPGGFSTKLYDSVVESIGTLIIREGRVVIHLAIALGIKIAVRGTSKTKKN